MDALFLGLSAWMCFDFELFIGDKGCCIVVLFVCVVVFCGTVVCSFDSQFDWLCAPFF